MQERRIDQRLPLRLTVAHILDEASPVECLSDDLSATGMRLSRCPGEAWGAPRHAWLEFQLPGADGELVRALGELRHEEDVEGDTRGFRFKYIYPRARRRLEAYLATHTPVASGG